MPTMLSRLFSNQVLSLGIAATVGVGTALPSVAEPSRRVASSPIQLAQAVAFSDIGGNTYEAEIVRAAELGLIAGPGDGTFRPASTVTREQAVSIILSFLNVTEAQLGEAANPFQDVPSDRWSAAKIAFAAQTDIVAGRGNGRFDPTATVTRAELMAMLSNAYAIRYGDRSDAPDPNFTFTDISGHWAEETISQLSRYCGGVSRPLNEQGTAFAPNAGATRAYTAAAVVHLSDCDNYEAGVITTPVDNSTTPDTVTTQSLGALSQPQVSELLAAHNRYRADVGIDPLSWSADLSLSAQDWADQLAATGTFSHSSREQRDNAGENLALNSNPSLTVMVDQWGAEKANYIPGVPLSQASTTGNFGDIGHYTQMVWRDTTQVGCGVASGVYQGVNATFLVCQYNPPGNFNNGIPY